MSEPGTIIRKARLARGLTLRDVAQATGKSVEHLDGIERGGFCGVPETLRKVAAFLGIPVETVREAYIAQAAFAAARLWDCKDVQRRSVKE